jgi:hypothetical protein
VRPELGLNIHEFAQTCVQPSVVKGFAILFFAGSIFVLSIPKGVRLQVGQLQGRVGPLKAISSVCTDRFRARALTGGCPSTGSLRAHGLETGLRMRRRDAFKGGQPPLGADTFDAETPRRGGYDDCRTHVCTCCTFLDVLGPRSRIATKGLVRVRLEEVGSFPFWIRDSKGFKFHLLNPVM